MSSILGICKLESKSGINQLNFKAMSELLADGGHKDSKIFSDKEISLFARIKKIKNSDFSQPIQNENGDITIIGDARCYNKEALKKEITEKKHKFSTESELEYFLHAYEVYGEEFIIKIKGVFAIAIWDSKIKKLLLYKDRMAVRPLFYYCKGKELVFSSEQKAIINYENYKLDYDPEAVRNFLNFRYNYSNQTLFKGVKKLPAAHYLSFSKDGIKIKKYWSIQVKENYSKSEEQLAKELKALLFNAVKERAISDVPIGAFMSGGVDSGGVAGMLSKFSDNVNTFSVGFAGYGFDELERAKKTAEFFGTKHTEINVTPDIIKDFPKMVWHMDEPMADMATVPNYVMSQHAKKRKIQTVFSGETNDEVWGGYDEYTKIPFRVARSKIMFPFNIGKKVAPKIINALPNCKAKELLDHCDRYYDPIRCYNRMVNFYDEENLYTDNFKKKVDMTKKPKEEITRRYINENQTRSEMSNSLLLKSLDYLAVHGYIVKQDRMTRSQALELNIPLIDSDIVEFSFTVPFKYKAHKGVEKYLYRQALKELFPPELYKRKKRGFDVPTKMWIPELKEHVLQILDDGTLEKRGIFNKEYMHKLMQKIENPDAVENQDMWNLLVLELWFRIYFDGLDPNKKLF